MSALLAGILGPTGVRPKAEMVQCCTIGSGGVAPVALGRSPAEMTVMVQPRSIAVVGASPGVASRSPAKMMVQSCTISVVGASPGVAGGSLAGIVVQPRTIGSGGAALGTVGTRLLGRRRRSAHGGRALAGVDDDGTILYHFRHRSIRARPAPIGRAGARASEAAPGRAPPKPRRASATHRREAAARGP
ncbi:MAG TPA: hypothetical protein VIL18_14580 [Longimicrobiales bacterium]